MKYKNIPDSLLLCALISQVQDAAKGDTETKVITYITRPLWRRFLKACKTPYGPPTAWGYPFTKVRRVFGSDTRLVKAKHGRDYRSWSFVPKTYLTN